MNKLIIKIWPITIKPKLGNEYLEFVKLYIKAELRRLNNGSLPLEKSSYIDCYQKAFDSLTCNINDSYYYYYINNKRYLYYKELLRIIKEFFELPKYRAREIVLCCILYPILQNCFHYNPKKKVSFGDLYDLTKVLLPFCTTSELFGSFLQYELIYSYIHYFNDEEWLRSFLNWLKTEKFSKDTPYLNLYPYGIPIFFHEADREYYTIPSFEDYKKINCIVNPRKTDFYAVVKKLFQP